MNKNLFTKELKRSRKNLIIWTAIVVGFTFMVLAIFPFMEDMGRDMVQLMDKMPEELGKAFGMDSQTWSNILGFYSTYYGVYIVVLMSIYTASTGANILSKEERDRTAEFLMTKPITRWEIFKTKMIALFSLSIIIYLIQTVSAIVGLMLFGKEAFEWKIFTIMQLSGLILMLFFTSCGVLLSMFLTPKKNFMGMVVGLTFGTYFLNAIGKSTDQTEVIGFASPFHYFDFTVFDPDYSFNFFGAFLFLVLSSGMIYLSYKTFSRKDINS
ncbi:MAG: ABC transporter permease subunit [Flavobacteriales bacterium]|nr:ABC transporter permease subunit [Flavobacteriales bacterium]